MFMKEMLHFIYESWLGSVRNWKASLAAALLLFFAVLLLGAVLLLRGGLADMIRYMDSQLTMKLFVRADYEAAEVAAAVGKLSAVRSVDVTSGEELLEEMRGFFRDKPRLLSAFEGALPDAVTLEIDADADLAEIAKTLEEMEAIESVVYPQALAEVAMRWVSRLETYGVAAVSALAISGFLTVYIAIRLAWMQRGKEIRLKLLLGANPKLVTMQFMLEAVWVGVLGGLPAAWLAVHGYGMLVQELSRGIPGIFADLRKAPHAVALLLAAAGPLLAALASCISVRGRVRDV